MTDKRVPDALPEDDELGAGECSLSNRLLDDLRAVIVAYEGSGLSSSTVIGCLEILKAEEVIACIAVDDGPEGEA